MATEISDQGTATGLPPLAHLRGILRKLNVEPLYFLIPALLSLGAAFFEGISVTLMVPLAKGVSALDFAVIKQEAFWRRVPHLSALPDRWILPALLGLVFLSIVAKNVLIYASSASYTHWMTRLIHNIRTTLFRRYLSFGKLFQDEANLGHMHTVLFNFTATLAVKMRDFKMLTSGLCMLMIYMVVLFWISWPMTLLMMVIFPVLNAFMSGFTRRIKRSSEAYAAARSALAKNAFNVLSCIPLVKAYANEERESSRFAAESEAVRRAEFDQENLFALFVPAQEIVVMLMVSGLVGLLSLRATHGGGAAVPKFLVYFYILRKASSQLGGLNQLAMSWGQVRGEIQAILGMLEDSDKQLMRDGSRELAPVRQGITCRRVHFSYGNAAPALKNIDMSIEKGTLVALVGPSSAGKSTLVSLLMRFYDVGSGSIQIDGVDIREYTLRSLRARIAIVSQDVYIFNDTIRNNLIYGLAERPSESRLHEALQQARLSDLVTKSAKGLDTMVGDRGSQLSGGEKQRLSIARALLKNCEILILDEATSALDSATEKQIQESLEELMAEKTVIAIAHRLRTLEKADKVYVLNEGAIVEEGRLAELLDAKGIFYRYWHLR